MSKCLLGLGEAFGQSVIRQFDVLIPDLESRETLQGKARTSLAVETH